MSATATTCERIRYWRERRGLSQAALGDLLCWTQSKVSRAETGAIDISAKDVEALVEKLGITLGEFYSARIRSDAEAVT